MSWSELQRLVETLEDDATLRRALRPCRSGRELVLAARRLGFAIGIGDLRQARALEQGIGADDGSLPATCLARDAQAAAAPAPPPPASTSGPAGEPPVATVRPPLAS